MGTTAIAKTTVLDGVMNSERRAKVFAALCDPTRVRLADLLACRGELSGTELAGELGISLALFSHHAGKMAEAGLLAGRSAHGSKRRQPTEQSGRTPFRKFQRSIWRWPCEMA